MQYPHIIDLHTHSTCSDGTYTPTELVELAKKIGLSALALTDHDTIDGLEEFQSQEKPGASRPSPASNLPPFGNSITARRSTLSVWASTPAIPFCRNG